MLATAGRPPEDGRAWSREMKWDGMRAITAVRDGTARLYSRTLREVTASFPEVAAAIAALADGRELIVDGELISPVRETGAPSFGRLQRRMHLARPTAAQIRATVVQLVAFDVLEIGGSSLMGLPYAERRAVLTDLGLVGPLVLTPPAWTDVDPATMLSVAREHGLEGIMSKRLDSTYQPGRRSRLWIKSPLRRTSDVVVAGWISSRSGGQDSIGSLILGAYDADSTFTYIGHVGTGFTARMRRTLRERLDQLARPDSPFGPIKQPGSARWVTPALVGIVEYREFVGTTLRHPSWRGLREDVAARDVLLPHA
nr:MULTISPECIES: non-homologous end-joining DNA ligase [Nocardia]